MVAENRATLSMPLKIGFGILLLLYPLLLLILHGGMNAVFFLTCILSIICLHQFRLPIRSYFDRTAIIFSIAMCSGIVAILFSQLHHGNLVLRTFDAPSRLLLAVLIFITLRRAPPDIFATLQYGFPLGAIAAGGVVLLSDHARATSYFIDRIHFGDLALLLGFLSILSLRWTRRDPYWLVVLKIVGLVVGIYVFIQAGQRGGLLAIPMVFVVWILLQNMQHKFRWFFLGTLALLALAALMYFFSPLLHMRLNAAYNELIDFWHGRNLASSTGVRIQQWQAGWRLFLQNPMFGVGAENVGQAMMALAQSGMITKQAALEAFGELHSDIVSYMARFGLFGLLAILAWYLVPLSIFVRAAKADSAFHRKAGIMGACFIAAFFVFGLTVENFNLKMVAAFYAMSVAVLLAAATHQGMAKDKIVRAT